MFEIPIGPRNSEMAEQCFAKKGSNPPVCALHNAPLKEHRRLRRIFSTFRFGEFTYLVCPVSGQIVDDPKNGK